MIATQIVFYISAVLGVLVSLGELKRAHERYNNYINTGKDALGLFVASHQVRIAIINVIVCGFLFVIVHIALAIMFTGKWADQLEGVLLTGLMVVAILMMVKGFMYRSEYGLMSDFSQVLDRGKNGNA